MKVCPLFLVADLALTMTKASFSWNDSEADKQNPILKEQVSVMNVLELNKQNIYQLHNTLGIVKSLPINPLNGKAFLVERDSSFVIHNLKGIIFMVNSKGMSAPVTKCSLICFHC